MANNYIEIMDTTLRDGEQTSGVSFSPAEKLTISKLLISELSIDRRDTSANSWSLYSGSGDFQIYSQIGSGSMGEILTIKQTTANVVSPVTFSVLFVKPKLDTVHQLPGSRFSCIPQLSAENLNS